MASKRYLLSRPGQHLENSEACTHQEIRVVLTGTIVLLFNIFSHRTIESWTLSLYRLSREIDFHFFYSQPSFSSTRRCSGCKKKSLRTNSFFEEFPRVALGTLLLSIYYFIADDSQRIAARRLGVNLALVSNIFRQMQDVCSRDLAERPIIPFGGPGSVVKCDESKFNHKAKVLLLSLFCVHSTSIHHLSLDDTLNPINHQTKESVHYVKLD